MADTNSKVAIIEDDFAIASMYDFKLREHGYKVAKASDGIEGMKLVESFKPDLILLDLMMPNLTGDKMLEKLRQTEWGKEIKVIVLTNLSKDEAPSELHLLNVDGYIVKAHYTPSQVCDIVDEVLGSKNKSK